MLAALILLCVPATSFAGMNWLFVGTITAGAPVVGPRHSLNQVSAMRTTNNGGNICVNAYNEDGSFAGREECTPDLAGGLAWHNYCACQLRYGYTRSSLGTATGQARQDW